MEKRNLVSMPVFAGRNKVIFVDVSSTNLDGKDASNVMHQSRGNILNFLRVFPVFLKRFIYSYTIGLCGTKNQ